MAHFLDGKKFEDEDEVKSAISDYFDSPELEFFEKIILSLCERWKQVIKNNGAYIDE